MSSSAFLTLIAAESTGVPTAESGIRETRVPLRVRERARPEALDVDVLFGARELRSLRAEELPSIVQALEGAGHVVIARFDADRQAVVYYAQAATLRAQPPAPRPASRAERGGRAGAERSRTTGAPASVHRYENEGSHRVSRGSVSVARDAWWSVDLAATESDAGDPGDAVLLRIERHGPSRVGPYGPIEADLAAPAGEMDALIVLLTSVVDQARRDGVLRPGAG